MFSFEYIVLKSDRPRAQYTIRLEVLKKIITIVRKELSVEIVKRRITISRHSHIKRIFYDLKIGTFSFEVNKKLSFSLFFSWITIQIYTIQYYTSYKHIVCVVQKVC